MAVMAREVWTDERLDDLNKRVDDGFKDIREELRAIRGEIAAMHRSFIRIFAGLFGTTAFGFLGVIVAIIAHG
jgi:hypothetical protein